jgi:protein-tyrosine-phosphatase
MAAAFASKLAEQPTEVFSGGSSPAAEVNPAAVAVMAEVGIDITDAVPQRWTDEVIAEADAVITMGCGDECPIFPGVRYEDWPLPDPAGRTVEQIRPIRDEIRARVVELLASLT